MRRDFTIFGCLVVALVAIPVAVYQVAQWRAEENRTPRVRVIRVVDAHERPIEGAQVRMTGESFRPVFPVLSVILQRGVWHPWWESDFQTTGRDGMIRFSYKSDSARIAELKIGNRSITTFSSLWLHADGTPEPADVYLVPEVRRNGQEEIDTVIVMKELP
jgi:hypothetical protein